MEKIIKALLQAKFQDVNTDALLEVISNTRNPSIATEIICGLYEEPEIPLKVKNEEIEYTFINYDKWNDKVHYSYKKKKLMQGYFPKGTKKEDITLENFKEKVEAWSSSKEQVNISIETGEIIDDTSHTSLEYWLRYHRNS